MHEDQVTDAMIESWVAEAEAGYAVEPLKRRGRGRPGRGAEPMQVVAVRLTSDELAALDRVVEREHLSRSEAIRRALNNYAA
ncbi:ribbon-helix-helix protein, CopG family [Dermacoccus nishinomiyaensis]